MYNEALHVKKGVEKLALEKLHVLKKSQEGNPYQAGRGGGY